MICLAINNSELYGICVQIFICWCSVYDVTLSDTYTRPSSHVTHHMMTRDTQTWSHPVHVHHVRDHVQLHTLGPDSWLIGTTLPPCYSQN